MAISQKQALILGVGGVAVLYLMKGKGVLAAGKPLSKTAAGRSPAAIPSSNMRPSANVATGGGTRTTAQNPSIRLGGPNGVQVPTSVLGGLLGGLASIFGAKGSSTVPKPQAPGSAPKGGGGGGPAGGSSGGRAQTGPGNNPWSDGTFVGQSSVTGNAAPSNGVLQGYDTGVSSGEYADVTTPNVSPSGSDALSQAREGMNADGSPSDEPPAVGYDDGGTPVADSGTDPLSSTPFTVPGWGDDTTASGDPSLNTDASVFNGGDASTPGLDDSGVAQPDGGYDFGGFIPDVSAAGDAGLDGGTGFNDANDWGE